MIRRDNFSPLNSAKQVFFQFTKKVNLTEMLMNKSISCLCYSKHIETKFCNKKQLNSIETLGVLK